VDDEPWQLEAEITNPSAFIGLSNFGHSVALHGNTAYIGTPDRVTIPVTDPDTGNVVDVIDGRVQLYVRTDTNGVSTWAHGMDIFHPTLYSDPPEGSSYGGKLDVTTFFGESISAQGGGRFLVSARNGDIPAELEDISDRVNNGAGEVFLFDKQNLVATYFSSSRDPIDGTFGNNFGKNVIYSEENIAIFELGNTFNNIRPRQVHLFEDSRFVPTPLCEPLGFCLGNCQDLNNNVDFNDLVAMLFQFGNNPGNGCDADRNGTVDFNDMVMALFLFGPCPEECPAEKLAEAQSAFSAPAGSPELSPLCTDILDHYGFTTFSEFMNHVSTLPDPDKFIESAMLAITTLEVAEEESPPPVPE